jgi:hypothetical protein
MGTSVPSSLLDRVWDYSLFQALYGRRSRRFGLGFEIAEGPLQHQSKQSPLPLSELEEALLVAAGIGVTGIPLWDGSRPPAIRWGDGRTFGSTAHGRRTALFFTNDSGVYAIGPAGVWANEIQEVQTRAQRQRALQLYQRHRTRISDHRLAFPRHVPPLFGHNLWDANQPGCTLFLPICDVSLTLISLIINLVDGERGRYVHGHGGGMSIVDDRQGGRPAGTEPWIRSGFLDKEKVLPLSILERQACYFMFSEPAVICHNMHLATEAIGLGGWMYCGFLSLEIMRALGARMETAGSGSFPHPIGFDGLLVAYCPPYHATMEAAVDAAVARMSRGSGAVPSSAPNDRPAVRRISDAEFRADLVEYSDAGVACAKAVCNYIYETYGRFPASIDALHLMCAFQAHHLDLDYYARHFHAGACSPTHLEHMTIWHPDIAGR